MAVKQILQQFCNKSGLSVATTDQRDTCLRFLNEAAMELYDQADAEGTLWEQLFHVNGDQQIALPPHVGPLRAMREYSTHVAWHLNNMRPRYNQFNWKDRWRSWRVKGVSPIMYPIVNQSVVKVSVGAVESPAIVVSVVGPTPTASSTSEQLTIDALEKSTTKNFMDITAIRKDRVNEQDVTVADVDGNALCVIPNNMLTMQYRLVDVSLYPWSSTDVTTQNHYMEVLFKKALPWLSNDDDEFPAQGVDNILVNKMLQLWAEEQGKLEEALAYDSKATRSLARKRADNDRGVEQEAAMVENPHDTLLARNRPMGPNRYTGQIYY